MQVLYVRHVFLVESQSAMGHGITRSLFSIIISWMEWAKETDEEILYSCPKEKKVDILLVRFYFFKLNFSYQGMTQEWEYCQKFSSLDTIINRDQFL